MNDNKPNYIYEVIKNTDDEWLKDAPNHKYLIDEWIFDYIDNDDRYHYGTAGNLVAVPNADDLEVVKIVDKKYKIEGGCGEYLVEDKLSYKERCRTYRKALEEADAYFEVLENIMPTITLPDGNDSPRAIKEARELINEVLK